MRNRRVYIIPYCDERQRDQDPNPKTRFICGPQYCVLLIIQTNRDDSRGETFSTIPINYIKPKISISVNIIQYNVLCVCVCVCFMCVVCVCVLCVRVCERVCGVCVCFMFVCV